LPQPDWEALAGELRDLARRVAELERLTGVADRAPASLAAAAETPAPLPAPPLAAPPLTQTAILVAVVGRAFLGLAGAYLLRAVTESGVLPARLGIAVGIAYALAWILWAAHTAPERRLEAAIHTLTAAFVLCPLLWEATLSFHAISTWTAGAILLLFTIFGMAAAWRKNLVVVSTIATLAGLGAAAALLMATHDVLPFTFLFLAVAGTVEASACLEHWLNERWLAAAAADLAVLLATWLVTNDRGLPEAYAPIPHHWLAVAQVALLAIYLTSTIARTLVRRFRFTGFEMLQCAAAFAISVSGGMRLANADHHAAPAMALLMLFCGAACYVVSFASLERHGARGRNFYTYSTFGILLALAGSRILLSGDPAAALWGALSVACIAAGALLGSVTLQFHGAAYLLAGLLSAGALQHAADLLLGKGLWPVEGAVALWLGAAIAALGYALSDRAAAVLRLAFAAVCLSLAAGIGAGLLTAAYHAWFGAGASHAYCATLRTGILAGSAVALTWCGAHWNRPELSRLMYPAMLLGAYRLIAEDLYQDRKIALFFSLVAYGAALIVLPKLKTSAEPKAGGGF
jgi:hypothetical protein